MFAILLLSTLIPKLKLTTIFRNPLRLSNHMVVNVLCVKSGVIIYNFCVFMVQKLADLYDFKDKIYRTKNIFI